jgi:hypothetical protein
MSANGASIPGWFISYRANSMPTTDVAKVDGPGSSLRFNDIEGLSMALLCTEATRISFSVIANQKLYFDEAVESSNLDSSVQRMEWVQRSFPDQATGWRHHATVVGGGVHAVRWVFEVDDDDGAMNLWLDQFKLEIPNASDVLGVSRNQPWAFSNDSWGLAPACYASERDEFIGSVKLHLDGSEWLETNVIGPARVAMKSKWLGSGQVRVGVELGGTTLGTTTATVVDQNNYGQATALSPWVVTTAEIPAGPQVVRWRYTSPVETAGSGGWLLVDDFILTKLGLQDLAEALDIPTQPLETDQRSVWSVTADEAQVGSTRVLGQLRGMPHAALSLPLTGPCLVSFQWQSSSYHLDVSLRTPRSRSYAITPSIGSYWGTVEEFIPPGQSVLQWVLATGTSVPEDTFGLDGVRITNDPVSLNEALDDPTGHYTAAVSGVYPMASGLRADDDDAVFLDNGSATSGWVQRTVEGPAVVHWKAPYGSSVSLDGIAMFNGGELIVPSGTHEADGQLLRTATLD